MSRTQLYKGHFCSHWRETVTLVLRCAGGGITRVKWGRDTSRKINASWERRRQKPGQKTSTQLSMPSSQLCSLSPNTPRIFGRGEREGWDEYRWKRGFIKCSQQRKNSLDFQREKRMQRVPTELW